MVIDSIGPVSDRENENLSSVIDEGIIMLRQMYLREMEKVAAGKDPKGIIRDPKKNEVITITAYEKWISENEQNAPLEGANTL